MKCPECQTENRNSQKFCGECGTRLEKVCPVCHTGNPLNYKFCGECGSDLNPVGYFKIDQNGLVLDVNPAGARLIAMEKDALIGKPFTLYIADEDIAVFFTHRNAVFSTGESKIFEIKLKKKNERIVVHIESTLTPDENSGNDQLRLAVVDITENRRALEARQFRHDLDNIYVSISGEMTRCAAREIDFAVNRALRTIGLFTEMDHCFIGELFDDESRIKITYEWFAPNVTVPVKRSTHFQAKKIAAVNRHVKSRKQLIINNTTGISKEMETALAKLSLKKIKSFAFFPMMFGDTLRGLVGFASLKPKETWSIDITDLYKNTSDLFLSAIMRKSDEIIWFNKRKEAIQAGLRKRKPVPKKKPVSRLKEDIEIYDGPIEELDDVPKKTEDGKPAKKAAPVKKPKERWVFRKASPQDTGNFIKVYDRDDKVHITCPNCDLRKDLSISKIEELGNTIKVRCPCRYEFHIMVEFRTAYRKQVHLEGYFMRQKSGKILSDSAGNWGTLWIKNISKRGLGFVAAGNHDIAPGDQFMIKFNLDNTAHSVIHKKVVVKSIKGDYVGCQFVGVDKYDVTLGFYMM
jgi:PAS domain S-box-containing protein